MKNYVLLINDCQWKETQNVGCNFYCWCLINFQLSWPTAQWWWPALLCTSLQASLFSQTELGIKAVDTKMRWKVFVDQHISFCSFSMHSHSSFLLMQFQFSEKCSSLYFRKHLEWFLCISEWLSAEFFFSGLSLAHWKKQRATICMLN